VLSFPVWKRTGQSMTKVKALFAAERSACLEIGRFWQVLLAAGLLFWFFLIWRAVAPARRDPERRDFANFFLIASFAPGGIMQVHDVIQNGYWHARSLAYTATQLVGA
jgi:nitric oxide reductase large subunit